MRKLLLILLLLPFGLLAQTKYYLSDVGNDSNNGTSMATPWKSITKLNTATLAPGDTVFFRAGDTFRGGVIVRQSGSPTASIVLTSYGAGAKASINGATLATNWTQHGDTFSSPSATTVRNFFVNGQQQVQARYPNQHQYLWMDSARTTYLIDQDLPGLPSNKVLGSRVCIHTSQWSWENAQVNALVLDTIKFQTPLTLNSLPGYGYFLYDNITHLDTTGEWVYVSGTQKIWYKPQIGQSPTTMTCEASTVSSGVQLDNDICYIKVENLDFRMQSSTGVYFPNPGSRYNVVNNCSFFGQYNHGVEDKGRYNEVANSDFRGIGGIAVYVYASGTNCHIHHNNFRQIGMQPNLGIGKQINLTAIMVTTDSCTIDHNDVDSVGYCGVSADGDNHLVERNVVRHCMLWNNDGAGLKSWGSPNNISQNIIWRNNFADGGDGTLEGTNNGDFVTPGFYFDFYVQHCLIQENTIYNHSECGIFQNSANTYNQLLGNVVYGGKYCLSLNGSPAQNVPQTGFEIKHNTFFALTNQDYLIRQVDYTNAFNTGVIDSNYYFQPYDANHYAFRFIGMALTPYNFAGWQATGNDAHTQSSFVNWAANQNDSRLFMNQTDDTVTINLLDSLYLDLDSNLICGTLQLRPYTSKVLINTLTLCNPTAVRDPEMSVVTVFPNPTSSAFIVRTGEDWIGAAYRLVDLTGHLLASGELNEVQQKLSLENCAAGIYFLEINGLSREVVRVMKQ